jgi:hypothetical protein
VANAAGTGPPAAATLTVVIETGGVPPAPPRRAAVQVLTTQRPCPLCHAPALLLCDDGNRVHLLRTVRVAATVSHSPLVADGWRISWPQGGEWLRWVCDPARPHLVFSEAFTALPADAEADERAWARIEIPLALAVDSDTLPPLTADAVTDPDCYGTPGALPPAPLPLILGQ